MKRINLMKGAVVLVFLITISVNTSAFTPRSDLTITMIYDSSDAFVYGVITDIIHNTENNLTTINKLAVGDIYFDKTNNVSIGSVIDIVTETNGLNSPEFTKGSAYLVYLRFIPSLGGFIATSGESSAFEVDTSGKVLNIHGYYILDVKDDKVVAGPKRVTTEDINLNIVKKKGSPPSAVLTDIYGRKTTIQPLTSTQAQEVAPEKLLDLQQFIGKMTGGKQ